MSNFHTGCGSSRQVCSCSGAPTPAPTDIPIPVVSHGSAGWKEAVHDKWRCRAVLRSQSLLPPRRRGSDGAARSDSDLCPISHRLIIKSLFLWDAWILVCFVSPNRVWIFWHTFFFTHAVAGVTRTKTRFFLPYFIFLTVHFG